MHVQIGGYRVLDGIEELAELDRAVPPVALTDDPACLGLLERRTGTGAMPNIVMGAPLSLAGPHWQQWPGAVQCLDLGLLVHTQDQRPIRRVDVQAHECHTRFLTSSALPTCCFPLRLSLQSRSAGPELSSEFLPIESSIPCRMTRRTIVGQGPHQGQGGNTTHVFVTGVMGHGGERQQGRRRSR